MTWLLDHLHPAVFGATVGAAVTAAVKDADLSTACAAAGIAGLVAFAVCGVLPLAWMAIKKSSGA